MAIFVRMARCPTGQSGRRMNILENKEMVAKDREGAEKKSKEGLEKLYELCFVLRFNYNYWFELLIDLQSYIEQVG